MRLVIEGCADDVEIALDKIGKMLGENSRISHALKLKLGVYRVLCFRSCDVQHDARYVFASELLQISCAEALHE